VSLVVGTTLTAHCIGFLSLTSQRKAKKKKTFFFFFGFFAAKTAERYLRARVRVGAIARLERVALARELERQHALGVHSRQHNTQKQHNGNHF
jgi:hypothetical protein